MTKPPLQAAIIPVTPLQQNCCLIWCTETMLGTFTDPGGDLDRLKAAADQHGVTIEKILLTHGHIDHCGSAKILADELGVEIVERETFAYSLGAGRKTLELLGIRPFEARERADRFRRHNVALLEAMVPHLDDEARRIRMARDAREELTRQMEQEQAQHDHRGIEGWHEDADADAEEPRT